MYLLDTDIISFAGRPQPSLHLVRRLASVPPDRQFTSAITLAELCYGAARARRPQLLHHIRTCILGGLVVLPFDTAAAERYGTVRAELERIGKPLAEPDLRIASIALARGLTLVTGNVRHFARVPGLRVEDWIAPPAVAGD